MSCSTARGPALALRAKWASRLMNGIEVVPINCQERVFKVRYTGETHAQKMLLRILFVQ
jgi:hypothetical protein